MIYTTDSNGQQVTADEATVLDNLVLATDSYKLNHWNQYPEGTEAVYSYLEAREGAIYPYTVFFGLQYLIKRYLLADAIDWAAIEEGRGLVGSHLGPDMFNQKGWDYIDKELKGKLPIKIRAVPEGTPVTNSNVLMTVENTDPKCYWLTNALESMLTHVWYPSTVATLSRHTLEMIGTKLDATGATRDGLPFMLHDFGYRGASSHESAAIGGAGHLVNSKGTDTVPAMLLAKHFYGAGDDVALSVPATEHSVMTSLGPDGEFKIVDRLLDEYPGGILSVVADSYNIYRFVDTIGTTFNERIRSRDGVFVVRPDSITKDHRTPEALVAELSKRLWHYFGGETNQKGYKVLAPQVRLLWGDGINPDGIEKILDEAAKSGFSAENYVFGMGGGLLQKINRDTQRFAFKASAMKRTGAWFNVFKEPLDTSKRSKAGRFSLLYQDGEFVTTPEAEGDLLQTVFKNGELFNETTFDEVRKRSAIL